MTASTENQVSLSLALKPLFEMKDNTPIENLCEEHLKRFELKDRIYQQIIRWKNTVNEYYVQSLETTHQMRTRTTVKRLHDSNLLEMLEKKLTQTALLTPEIDSVFNSFKTCVKKIANTKAEEPKPIGIGSILLGYTRMDNTGSLNLDQHFQRSSNSIHQQAHKAKLIKEFKELDPKNKTDWAVQLSEKYQSLSHEDRIFIAKHLTFEQFSQLITAAQITHEKGMKDLLPCLLVTVNHSCLVHLLDEFPVHELNSLNTILKQYPEVKEEWFQDLFKGVRKGFIDEFNDNRKEIDLLNEKLRDLKEEQISSETLSEIDDIKSQIEKQKDRLDNLQLFIGDIVEEVETLFLANQGFADVYKSLLKRLTKDHTEVEPGSPYGILYRKIFGDKPDVQMTTADLFYKWKVDEKMALTAKQKGINTIGDIIDHQIFNKKMLTEYLEKN